MAQMVKNLPTMWETRVQSLGREDPLEKGMATHSSILAYWTEEPGGLQSMGHKESDTTERLTPASSQRKGVSQESPEIVKSVMVVHTPLHQCCREAKKLKNVHGT